MSWSRFEYFLNAIHYSIWLGEIRNSKRIEKIVYAIFNPLLRFLLTESQHDALLERRQKYASRNKKFVNDMNIGCANSWFGLFYSCYFGWPDIFLMSILIDINTNVKNVIFAIPIIVGYIPAYKAVFYKDRYLEYFKEFRKKDERWHKKWKWISRAFRIGGVMLIALSLFLLMKYDI